MENPYASPIANPYGSSTLSSNAVPPGTIAALSGAKGWLRFLAIFSWLLALLILVGLVGMLSQNVANSPRTDNLGKYLIPALVAAYAVIAVVVFYGGCKLWKYASDISRLQKNQSVADLDQALNQQRTIWRYIGISVIVGTTTYIIGILAFVFIVIEPL